MCNTFKKEASKVPHFVNTIQSNENLYLTVLFVKYSHSRDVNINNTLLTI